MHYLREKMASHKVINALTFKFLLACALESSANYCLCKTVKGIKEIEELKQCVKLSISVTP